MQPDKKAQPIIHTFESDIQSELSRRGDSLMDVAAVQSVKETNNESSRNIKIIIAITFICFIIGAAIAGYMYWSNANTMEPAPIAPPQIVYETTEYMPTFGDALLPYSKLSGTSSSYIIIKINQNSFDGAYQATLKNEKSLISDYIKYFSISSSTLDDFSIFRDVNVKNYDLRISESGNNQAIYGFVNSEYLIIAITIDDWFRAASTIIKIK